MNSGVRSFKNPYKPGAGHMPPHLAGRYEERQQFDKILDQDIILENVVLTGLRGVGKTVLLETFKPTAQSRGWLWVGTDLSESTSVNEENLALRILTDLSLVTASIVTSLKRQLSLGFDDSIVEEKSVLDYDALVRIFKSTPGLISDKLKVVLEIAWEYISKGEKRGMIFAYDEAQTMADHAGKDQFPLSLMLDVFQSIQKKGIPFMLILTGLPTLFPKLVEARTYAERMFHVIFLTHLKIKESREAIMKPIGKEECPISFDEKSVELICNVSGGYPYFIQFLCREIFDICILKYEVGELAAVPINSILHKLDNDFFAGRWAKATDRQRDLLVIVAHLDNSHLEFTVQEVVEASQKSAIKSFKSSHVNQMLSALSDVGLIYKNRHGKYSFSVPLFDKFIRRQIQETKDEEGRI